MRPLLAIALLLALTTPLHAAEDGATFRSVPAGARVRLTLADRTGTVNGSLLRAGPDSLAVAPVGGGPALAVPVSAVRSLAWLEAVVPSPRKGALLGIGLGAAGGAVIGVVAGQAQGDGGGGGVGGGEGGGPVRDAVLATTAVTPAQARATQDYRAVMGAVVGGLVGGIFGSLTGMGMTEARWTPVSPSAAQSSWAPAPAAPAIFAVRIPWPRGARR
jgi:hypothetical protein